MKRVMGTAITLVTMLLVVWWMQRDPNRDEAPLGGAEDGTFRALPPATCDEPPNPAKFLPPGPELVASLVPADAHVSGTDAPASVSGIVVRQADGSPLVKTCLVMAIAIDDRLHDHAIVAQQAVGDDGRFAFGADVAARDPLWLQVEWHQRGLPEMDRSDPSPVDTLMLGSSGRESVTAELPLPKTASRQDLRLVVDTGWIVRGHVVHENGRPFAFASIRTDDGLQTSTDLGGNFTLRDLDERSSVMTLTIGASGYLQQTLDVPVPLIHGVQDADTTMLVLDRDNR